MAVIQPSLYILLDRFPERKETIKALFKNNESFRTLCQDYRRCSEALQHWNQSLDEDAAARMREYEALLRDLEEEILENVNEST
jgi:HEPN domain-containing protein